MFLAAGNVVIGRREEGEVGRTDVDRDRDEEGTLLGERIELGKDDADTSDIIDLQEGVGSSESSKAATKKGEDADDPLI